MANAKDAIVCVYPAPAMKYPQAHCAWCGSVVKGKGYFCSPRCDAHEYSARSKASEALYLKGKPVKRKEQVALP